MENQRCDSPQNGKKKSQYIDVYYRLLSQKAPGSWIGYNSQIHSVPEFPHGICGIFISGSAVIGKNCVIFHHVTIGSNTVNDSKRKGAPKIGDNVFIGCGAKIIGGVTIGNNCRIGANSVVVEDIPDNTLVVMNKPRLITKPNMDNHLYYVHNGKWGYNENGNFVESSDYDASGFTIID